mgnify:CR=1 FL=1
MKLLTIKGWITSILVLLIFLTVILMQKWLLLLFELPLLYTLLLSLSYLPISVDSIQVYRKMSKTRMVEGDEVKVQLEIRNDSQKTLILGIFEQIDSSLEISDGTQSGLFVLKPGETKVLNYKVLARRRGHYLIGPAKVEAYDPFMLQRVNVLELEPDEIVVLPQMPRKYRLLVRARYTIPRPGVIASRQYGEGGDFLEVREAEEIILRRVNWKATARTQHWMINAFEGERLTNVLVVLDVNGKRLLGNKIEGYVDELVRITASIVYSFINAGNNVSLLVIGNYRDWIRPGSGKKHLFRILSSLADVRYLSFKQVVEYEEVFKKVSLLVSPKGSSVVIISSYTSEETLKLITVAENLGYSVTCVAVNPFSLKIIQDERLHDTLSASWKQGLMKILPGKKRRIVVIDPI